MKFIMAHTKNEGHYGT